LKQVVLVFKEQYSQLMDKTEGQSKEGRYKKIPQKTSKNNNGGLERLIYGEYFLKHQKG